MRKALLTLLCAALTACVAPNNPSPSPLPPKAIAASPARAEPPPAWKLRPVVPDALEVAAATYTVQPGDSLRVIARRTGAGSEAIARENQLSAPFVIHPGQRLRIPGGRYHLVRPGQTGIAIARAYGVDWSRIVAINDLEEPYILRTNMRLLLPSKAQVAAMTIEERAAAFTIDIDDLITGTQPALAAREKPVGPAIPKQSTPSGQFGWPVEGSLLTRFGPMGQGRISQGINIAANAGTPVHATADGTIAYVGDDIAALGKLVLIRHADGWISAYAHNQSITVAREQAVRRGQMIARVGSTGSVGEPQVHFELRKGRGAVDPLKYLPPRAS
ncbi:peptidoglycan DD-metalloendopeptidase family protein [Sphingomonas sp. ID0503]|uniref:peptidoglycan DD-metalloendopeptidase family protein n=1 Tax=Sphingomonas sp. ID0503 TaxID=3399691 RepID=UPI003AFA2CAC